MTQAKKAALHQRIATLLELVEAAEQAGKSDVAASFQRQADGLVAALAYAV